MVKRKQQKMTPGVQKRRAGIGALLKRIESFEMRFTGYHNKLAHLVNAMVIPNMNSISDTVRQLNTLFTRHVVILEILQHRIGGITNGEFEATKKRLFDIAKKNTQDSSVRSEEARSDEDRDGDAQPGLLDAESNGEDEGSTDHSAQGGESSGVQFGEQGESAGASDSEHPTPDSGKNGFTLVEPTKEERKSY